MTIGIGSHGPVLEVISIGERAAYCKVVLAGSFRSYDGIFSSADKPVSGLSDADVVALDGITDEVDMLCLSYVKRQSK